MKIDRLYGEMLYLLQKESATAAEMAESFEVSIRTVQRDMDTLAMAGIPITALAGRTGGYRIEKTFDVRRHPATEQDFSHIRTALRGLATATDDPAVQTTLNKMLGADESHMVLDFSILKEGAGLLRQLQQAAAEKKTVSFTYTNAADQTRRHTVQPVAVVYQWYSWYLLGFVPEKEDYRIYKLVRMEAVTTGEPFTRQHPPAETLLQKKTGQPATRLTLRCAPQMKTRVTEYLQGAVVETLPDGWLLMTCSIVESEHFWLGTVLGLGKEIEVLEPAHIRDRIRRTAEETLQMYGKDRSP